MLEIYQHIPEHLNPIAFSIGSFSVRWYSLMYLVAFVIVYSLLKYRLREIKNIEAQSSKLKAQNQNLKIKFNKKNNILYKILDTKLLEFMFYLIIGLLIGARLGYVFFYDFGYYSKHILEICLPIQVTSYGFQVTGFYGLSYFGGLVGVVIAGLVFSKKYKLDFWQVADFVVPAVPAGYFFGRIGNFLNGELYGCVTDVSWGMYFPADLSGFLRHPSQLYEAFFEGLVLFVILWVLKRKKHFWTSDVQKQYSAGGLFLVYLFFYGFFRFFVEFFREPDEQIGYLFGFLTLGQIFSLLLIIISIILWYNLKKKNSLDS